VGTAQSREALCVLHSLERHCVCTAQSREALHVCTAQSREALPFSLYGCVFSFVSPI